MVNDILPGFMHWKSLFKSDLETDSESEKHGTVSQSINKYSLGSSALNARKPGCVPAIRRMVGLEFLSLSSFLWSSSLPMLSLRAEREGGMVLGPSRAVFQHQGNILAQGEFYSQRACGEKDGLNLDPAIPKNRQRWKYAF